MKENIYYLLQYGVIFHFVRHVWPMQSVSLNNTLPMYNTKYLLEVFLFLSVETVCDTTHLRFPLNSEYIKYCSLHWSSLDHASSITTRGSSTFYSKRKIRTNKKRIIFKLLHTHIYIYTLRYTIDTSKYLYIIQSCSFLFIISIL